MPTLSPPPLDNALSQQDGKAAPPWARWLQLLWDKVQSPSGFAHYTITTGTAVLNAVEKIINFDTAVESAAEVTTGANWKYTAARPGLYCIQAAVGFPFTTAAYFVLSCYKNGAAGMVFGLINGNNSDQIICGGATRRLAAGDYLDVRAYHQDGGTRTSFTLQNCWITVERVGD